MKKTVTETVKILGEQVEAEKEIIKSLEAKLADMREEKARAEQLQEAISYEAETTDNHAARAQLETAEETLSKIDKRVRSVEIAAAKANQKLTQLQEGRAAAQREAKRQEYSAEATGIIDDGKVAEEAVAALTKIRDALAQRITRMDSLALEAGLDPARHQRCMKNFWRAIEQRIHPNPVWLSKDARRVFREPVPDIFEQTLKDTGGEIEQPEQQAAAG